MCCLARQIRAHSSHFADTETGPGVYETALAYTTALRMADNAILFKFATKSIGMKHGIVPSFMAKPWGNVSTSPFFSISHPHLHLLPPPASWMQWVSISFVRQIGVCDR